MPPCKVWGGEEGGIPGQWEGRRKAGLWTGGKRKVGLDPAVIPDTSLTLMKLGNDPSDMPVTYLILFCSTIYFFFCLH